MIKDPDIQREIQKAWTEIVSFGPRKTAELLLTPNNRVIDARHRSSPAARASMLIGHYRRDVTLAQLTGDIQFVFEQREMGNV